MRSKKSGVESSGVSFNGLPLLDNDGFRKQLEPYLGQSLTMAQLDKLTKLTVNEYRRQNRPLVDVVAPEQNVQSGVIQILVTEFLVGKVTAQGNRWFSSRLVTAPISLRHGDDVDSLKLLNELDAANSNPFRQVNLIYKPSGEPGYTDLVLNTEDRFPARFYTSFDNSGTPATGLSRWNMGLDWGNAFWNDQQLSYHFSASDDFFDSGIEPSGHDHGSFIGHSLIWTKPMAWGDSVSIFGNYQQSVPNLGTDFGLVGRSGQASIRYNKRLRRTGALSQILSVGYDFKSTNNNLAFGGESISRNTAEIDQFPVGYSLNYSDKHGSTSVVCTLVYSPGHITTNNTDSAFQPGPGQAGTALATANYIYWRSDATRLTKLPKSAIWASRFIGQASTRNLLYTEQLAGGGAEVLRGYDTNSILGDQGVVLSNELRTATFRKAESAFGEVQFLVFWDYAHVSRKIPVLDDVNRLNASSVGVGIRYNLRSNLVIKADYGFQ
jgi:hemolysin activation/secretion protein